MVNIFSEIINDPESKHSSILEQPISVESQRQFSNNFFFVYMKYILTRELKNSSNDGATFPIQAAIFNDI